MRDAADKLEDSTAILSDLDRPEEWASKNLMKSNKGQIQSPVPGKEATNPGHRVCLVWRKGD